MDVRRVLPFLLLSAHAVSVVLSATSGRGDPSLARLPRRAELKEFLVPPPPPQHQPIGPRPGNSRPFGPRPHGPSGPRPHGPHPPGPFSRRPPSGPHFRGPHPPGRAPRLVNPKSPEASGYLATIMRWLNPFNYGVPEETPPQIGLQHPPPQVYGGPPPVVYGQPPPHPADKNHLGSYAPRPIEKNCNPCNKEPWIPMQDSGSHQENPAYGVPPPPPLGESYGPPPEIHENRGSPLEPPPVDQGHSEVSYGPPPAGQNGFHGGFSHEVRTPDFSYNPPLPVTQDGRPHPINPLPNPHLYPGPMPPLFKAESFDQQPVIFNNNNPEYLDAPPPSSVEQSQYGPPPNIPSGPHGQSLVAESAPPNFHGSFNAPSFEGPSNFGDHPEALDHQFSPDVGVKNSQGYDNVGPIGQDQDFGPPETHEHDDLHSSGSHLNQQSHVNSITAPGKEVNGISGNKGFTDGTSLGHYDQRFSPSPSSVDLSNISENQKRHEDSALSSSIVKSSHVTTETPVSPGNLGGSIHFEQSPLVDLTKQDETTTDLPIISSTSRGVTFFELDESTGNLPKTTLNYDPSHFNGQTQPTTESYDFSTIAVINSAATSETEGHYEGSGDSSHESRDPRGPEVSYISPSGQPGYLWSIVSTTLRPKTDDKALFDALLKSYNNFKTGQDQQSLASLIINSVNGSRSSQRQQGVKRHKQVQVIIPYTSQYTPMPFQQSYGDWKGKINLEQTQARKVPQSVEPNRYDYIAQESRKEDKITDSTKLSAVLQNNSEAQSIREITRQIDRSSSFDKINTSIDVHRLQKNIDNWTIQEYSRSPTSSTMIPNSSRPYLSPSKKIPNEYLTTTESIKQQNENHDDNVKTFALAGFSFNDVENEGSSSDQVESGRVKVSKEENEEQSTEKSEDTSDFPTTTEETLWRGFSVSISPFNKERVYVVTPQTIPTTSKSTANSKSSEKSRDAGSKKTKNKSGGFEAIEKVYQVLPQAVNNLAVASTGPETVPLWGIMEHEEFASLTNNKHEDNDGAVSPVLYSGHSKVSRGKR